jgi:hypothetical protein
VSDGEDAESPYREAVDRFGRTRLRVELGRAHLIYGEWLRRRRRRRDARDQLGRACEIFDSNCAAAFAERARIELRASGGQVREPAAEMPDALTAQEALIARLPTSPARHRTAAHPVALTLGKPAHRGASSGGCRGAIHHPATTIHLADAHRCAADIAWMPQLKRPLKVAIRQGLGSVDGEPEEEIDVCDYVSPKAKPPLTARRCRYPRCLGAQRAHREEGRGAVKPWESPRGLFSGQPLINEVGDIPEAHPRHFFHGFKLLHDLRGNTV